MKKIKPDFVKFYQEYDDFNRQIKCPECDGMLILSRGNVKFQNYKCSKCQKIFLEKELIEKGVEKINGRT